MQGGSGARRRQSPLRSDAPGQTHGPRSPLGVCLELPPFSPTVVSCSGAGARPRGRSVHSIPQSPRRGGKRQKTKTEEKESALGDQLALRSRLPDPVQRGGPGAGPRPGPVLSCPVLSSYTPRRWPAHGRPPCSSPPAERVGAGRARAYLVVLTGRVQATAGWVAFLGWVRSESGERGGARRSLPAALRGVLACSYRHK